MPIIVVSAPDTDETAQWTPNNVTPTLWLDAQDASTFTESGGKVVTWADKSGNGNDVTQATAGNRPTRTTSIINGRTGVRSTGQTIHLGRVGFAVAQPFTVMAVVTLTATTGYETFFGGGDSSPATDGPEITTDFGAANEWLMVAGAGGLTGIDSDVGFPHALIAIFNGASSNMYIDGVQVGGFVDPGSQACVDLRLGSTYSGAGFNYADFDFGEIIVVPGILATTDIEGFSAYAATQWAVPNNSGGNPGAGPTLVNADPPDGNDDDVYSYTFTVAGDTPTTWTVASGAVPSGLSFSSGGVLSGTLTTPGTFPFTVNAANATGSVNSPSIVMVIGASSPVVPTITTTTLAGGTEGSAYSQTVHATGTSPITWSKPSGTLPTSLSLNAGTGAITGTPSMAGTYTFTIRATNGTGTDDQAFTVNIAAAGARQTVALWTGVNQLYGGARPYDLSYAAASGITQVAVQRGAYTTDNPSWLRSAYASTKATVGRVGAGFYMASRDNEPATGGTTGGVPTSNGAADSVVTNFWTPLATELVAAGGDFFAIDPEPYIWAGGGDGGGVNNPWSTTYTSAGVMTHFGDALGTLAVANGLSFVIYIASNCWWQGSNQYEIALQNGSPSTALADILFVYFVHGLVDAGATVNLMDAAFQHPGYPNSDYNDSYTEAVAHLCALTDNEFGAGVVTNNMMPWPWNRESGGVWSHGSFQYAVDQSTIAGTGPLWIYDGDPPDGFTGSGFNSYFDDIAAGVGA